MTYEQAVERVSALLGDTRKAHFGLERVRALAAALGDPQRAYRVIHVAGTNGKGSTAAMIEAGLLAAGFSVGLYTSPHLSRFNERFRLDGRPISDEGFAASAKAVLRAIESFLDGDESGAGRPTMFEAVTAMAFHAFREANVDWGVIEVGLGGRLDATNIVEPEAAVITAVDFDHEAWLGMGAEAIAREKAGILKPGCRAVFSSQRPEVAAVLRARARELGIPATESREVWRPASCEADGSGRCRLVAENRAGERLDARLGLRGDHQVENALTAAAALDAVGVGAAAIAPGLASADWPGRLELIPGPPDVLLDAAHNPSGARVLAAYLKRFHAGRRILLIYGSSRDKAVEESASLLFDAAAEVIVTRAQVGRAVGPATLEGLVDHLHPRIAQASDAAAALDEACRRAGDEDLIVVAGSIFLVGEVREAPTVRRRLERAVTRTARPPGLRGASRSLCRNPSRER